jgi:hypothetical protein
MTAAAFVAGSLAVLQGLAPELDNKQNFSAMPDQHQRNLSHIRCLKIAPRPGNPGSGTTSF